MISITYPFFNNKICKRLQNNHNSQPVVVFVIDLGERMVKSERIYLRDERY